MDCPSDQTLALLLEGALDDAERSVLRAHLGSCESCAAAYDRKRRPAGDRSAPPANGTLSIQPSGATVEMAEPRAGLVIGGRYRLERLLGEGGMGTVWAAEHVLTQQRFALKLIRASDAQRPRSRRRMLREARLAGALHHPNVVHVVDAFVAATGTPVLVMELLEGRTLRERLRAGPLSLEETARLLVPAMAAVESAHVAGVVHRDLKPDNLFLVALPGGAEEVRVLDFGLARVIAADPASGQLTRSGEMLGTPTYMSPEQAFGETDLDERTDVWSMGVILYECLTGRRPFEGENLGQVLRRITSGERRPVREAASALPVEVADVIERMLTVPREQRPRDLGDAIAVLSSHGGGPVEARRIRPRWRWPAFAIGGSVAAAAAIGVLVLAPPSGDAPAEQSGAPVPSVAEVRMLPAAEVVDAATPPSPVRQDAAAAAPPERSPAPTGKRRATRPDGARTVTPAKAPVPTPAPAAERPRVQREDDL